MKKVLGFILAVCVLFSVAFFAPDSATEQMASNAATSNFPVFQQQDVVWYQYNTTNASDGKTSPLLGPTGCGLFATVNSIRYMTGNIMDVKALADWAYNFKSGVYNAWGFSNGGLYPYVYLPNVANAFGARYGFTLSQFKSGTIDNTAVNHLKQGHVIVANVPGHFIALVDYDAATDRILVLDSSTQIQARNTSMAGNWLTRAELQGEKVMDMGSGAKQYDKVSLWAAFAKTGSQTVKNYSVTQTASTSGTIFFGGGETSTSRGGGDTVFFKVVPASGKKISSISINNGAVAYTVLSGIPNGPQSFYFKMPSANVNISVTYTSGGITSSGGALTSKNAYAVGEGITCRADCSTPGVYLGMFKSTATSYTLDTAIFYYQAADQWYPVLDQNSGTYVGYTRVAEAGFKGGNISAYGSGSFKILLFNPSTQAAVSGAVNFTLSGSYKYLTTLTYSKGGTSAPTQNPSTPTPAQPTAAPEYQSLPAADLVFDQSSIISWINTMPKVATNLSIALDDKGDTCLKAVTSSASDDPQFYLPYESLTAKISANTYKYLVITAKTDKRYTKGRLFPATGNAHGPVGDYTIGINWINDGQWHDYIINLGSLSQWSGAINNIRLDYYDCSVAKDAAFYLRSLKFYTSAPTSPKVTLASSTYNVGDNIVVNYSGLDSYLNTNSHQHPFIGIYLTTTTPGSASAIYYTYVTTASGSVTITKDTAGSNKGKTLAAGTYSAWLAYDGAGSNSASDAPNTVNNVHYSAESSHSNFTIIDPATVQYSVSTSVIGEGGVAHFGNNVTSASATKGTTIYFQVTPNAGYKASTIKVGDNDVEIENYGEDCVYSFSMPAKDTVVKVTFERAAKTDYMQGFSSDSINAKYGGTVAEVLDEIRVSFKDENAKIFKSDGTTEISTSSSKLATGMIVKVGSMTYNVVVQGDVNGDGIIDISDVTATYSALRGKTSLSGAFKKAATEGTALDNISIISILMMLNSI